MAKKTIALIGATEEIGAVLAKSLVKYDHRLLLFSENAEKLTALAKEIKYNTSSADLECLACLVDASWEADLIILTLPHDMEKEIAVKIRQVATQKTVISIITLVDGLSYESAVGGTEELQILLPVSKLVKVFINSHGVAHGREFDSIVTGSNQEAVQLAAEIILLAGFRPILAGAFATTGAL